jgi:hypothetical protein
MSKKTDNSTKSLFKMFYNSKEQKKYEEWYNFFEKDLEILFENLIYNLKSKNLLYKEYDFKKFCKLIYNKSSKRIPLY